MLGKVAADAEAAETLAAAHDARDRHQTPRFHRLKVSDVRQETSDSVSVAFELPPELADRYSFFPGEYLTLRHVIDGKEIRRCYSISSGLDDGDLRVVVKKVAGGVFSSFVHSDLRPEMQLDVMTPMGTFTAPIEPAKAKTYLGIAAGSGITPIMSVLRSVLSREPGSTFILLYGNRSANSIIFRDSLDDLKDLHLGRLSVFHVLSREATDVPLSSGRLDAEKLRMFARTLFDPAAIDHAFLCGPASMIAGLRETLAELGVRQDRIRDELFTPAEGVLATPAPHVLDTAPVEGIEVTAILDGTARRFRMSRDNESVVDAAHEHGIELPYSCKGGMCSTCRAKLIDGQVEMMFNYSLEPWEVEAGYVLTCQARPTTPTITLDYDQV